MRWASLGAYLLTTNITITVSPLTVGENAESATVELLARFDSLRLEEWSPTWRVRIEAEMVEHEKHGWQVVRSRRETLWSDGKLVGATRR